MAESLAFNTDCMDAMKRFPDKYFDLAVVDPPYGIGIGSAMCIGRGGQNVHSEEIIQVYGAAKSKLTKRNFIIRSMIAPHRTRNISRSL